MKEKVEVEVSTNTFLKSFFDATYNENKLLFNNMSNIYKLISFLYYNIDSLDVEKLDLRDGTRADYMAKSKLIDNFYKNIGINFRMEEITSSGVLNIISTNNPKKATYKEIYTSNNNYVIHEECYINIRTQERVVVDTTYHKAINVYNNDLVTDSIIWVHEISHYRNQPSIKRGEVNDILTELLAFTEELIYADYLEGIGYQEAVNTFKISEYNNFYSIINQGFHIIRITLLYYLLGKVSEENYKLLYHDDNYQTSLEVFDKERINNQNIMFIILYYSVAIFSLYNYIEYKKDSNFLKQIEELNESLLNDRYSLEDSLKIINIKLNKESLDTLLEDINIFKDTLLSNNKTKTLKPNN